MANSKLPETILQIQKESSRTKAAAFRTRAYPNPTKSVLQGRGRLGLFLFLLALDVVPIHASKEDSK